MTYIENIFVCIAAPLLVAALCMGRRYLRFFLFAFAGMGACLIASYLNTFFAALYGAPRSTLPPRSRLLLKKSPSFCRCSFISSFLSQRQKKSSPP